jgi:hypothetical protein
MQQAYRQNPNITRAYKDSPGPSLRQTLEAARTPVGEALLVEIGEHQGQAKTGQGVDAEKKVTSSSSKIQKTGCRLSTWGNRPDGSFQRDNVRQGKVQPQRENLQKTSLQVCQRISTPNRSCGKMAGSAQKKNMPR